MLALMHQAEPYGHLVLNGKPIDDATLARMVGESPAKVRRAREELERAGTFSRDEDGAIYSRRMVKDEHIRNVRSDAGKQGGNPALVGAKDKREVKQTNKQNPTPSSSSSSSSSTSSKEREERARAVELSVDWQPPDWTPARLLMAGAPQAWTPQIVGAFVAHYRGQSLLKTEKEWGELFVKWMLREQTFGRRNDDSETAKFVAGGAA